MAGNRQELHDKFSSFFTSDSELEQNANTEEEAADGRMTGQKRIGFVPGRKRKDSPSILRNGLEERTTLILNRRQYAVIRAISMREGLTIKSIVEEMFRMGIEKYEKKHGKVEPDDGTRVQKIF